MRGIAIMAYHRRRYLRQAYHLALSLRYHSPTTKLALITDQRTQHKGQPFDMVIPMDSAITADCLPKLDLIHYTPFTETLYLDADALAIRDVNFLFDRLAEHEFAVMGSNISQGYWYADVTRLCQQAGTQTVPKFSAGFLYFRKTSLVAQVFTHAQALAEQYEALQLDHFNGGIADEPLLSIALAHTGIRAQPTTPDTVVSLLGSTNRDIDVATGHSRFRKKGKTMHPAIVHFAADYSSSWKPTGALYRRECRRIRKSTQLPHG